MFQVDRPKTRSQIVSDLVLPDAKEHRESIWKLANQGFSPTKIKNHSSVCHPEHGYTLYSEAAIQAVLQETEEPSTSAESPSTPIAESAAPVRSTSRDNVQSSRPSVTPQQTTLTVVLSESTRMRIHLSNPPSWAKFSHKLAANLNIPPEQLRVQYQVSYQEANGFTFLVTSDEQLNDALANQIELFQVKAIAGSLTPTPARVQLPDTPTNSSVRQALSFESEASAQAKERRKAREAIKTAVRTRYEKTTGWKLYQANTPYIPFLNDFFALRTSIQELTERQCGAYEDVLSASQVVPAVIEELIDLFSPEVNKRWLALPTEDRQVPSFKSLAQFFKRLFAVLTDNGEAWTMRKLLAAIPAAMSEAPCATRTEVWRVIQQASETLMFFQSHLKPGPTEYINRELLEIFSSMLTDQGRAQLRESLAIKHPEVATEQAQRFPDLEHYPFHSVGELFLKREHYKLSHDFRGPPRSPAKATPTTSSQAAGAASGSQPANPQVKLRTSPIKISSGGQVHTFKPYLRNYEDEKDSRQAEAEFVACTIGDQFSRCYTCGKPGHRADVCPQSWQLKNGYITNPKSFFYNVIPPPAVKALAPLANNWKSSKAADSGSARPEAAVMMVADDTSGNDQAGAV
jgi:hypothetical protein